jgi:circadian clock protein KaiC
MTAELPDLFETRTLSEHGISHLADNVVLLEYVRQASALRRALTVLKTRTSRHEPETREYTITTDGIALAPHAR